MRRLATALVVIGVLLVAGGELGGPPTAGGPGGRASIAATLMPTTPSTCEAPQLSYLIGKPRSQIPVPVDPSKRRVSCTTCPVTEDFRPERTDILFDQATGLVTAVKCG